MDRELEETPQIPLLSNALPKAKNMDWSETDYEKEPHHEDAETILTCTTNFVLEFFGWFKCAFTRTKKKSTTLDYEEELVLEFHCDWFKCTFSHTEKKM